RAAGEQERRLARRKEVSIQTRRRPHGARDGRPEEGVIAKLPCQPRIGLDFEPGVAIGLELHPQRQREAFVESNTVLDKAVDPGDRTNIREKRQTRAVGDRIVHHAVAPAPHDLMARGYLEAVLRLNVIRVEQLTEGPGIDPPGPIKIALNLEG